jgi:hypothetical protein
MEIATKKAEARWEDYKIYPSSLKSMGQCPKDFIASLAKPSTIEDILAIYKVKRGSAVHLELQKDLLLSDKIAPMPNQEFMTDRIKEKLLKGWPEAPFHSMVTRHSGSADGVILVKGRPTGVEIKTTSIDFDRWKNMSKPSDAHIFQVCDYMYHFKLDDYYDPPIDTFIIAYLNLLYPPGDQDAEKEFEVHFSDHEERYLSYINEETRQLNAYIEGTVLECKHEFCHKHKEKK